ncbi:hypothetical protein M404DRAFT_25257 [Pisolithus tinctorius Marx 270]|uniref:Uncharacterized protein n=1 Tax=Pisolithus tinctorius Marx 270 TaxID=870435 RepID=A0A0C3NXH7_PISTI|nr:hypothetical protein M404DRAFT_25257 [Pisolithus tinctorius Marx 270]
MSHHKKGLSSQLVASLYHLQNTPLLCLILQKAINSYLPPSNKCPALCVVA